MAGFQFLVMVWILEKYFLGQARNSKSANVPSNHAQVLRDSVLKSTDMQRLHCPMQNFSTGGKGLPNPAILAPQETVPPTTCGCAKFSSALDSKCQPRSTHQRMNILKVGHRF